MNISKLFLTSSSNCLGLTSYYIFHFDLQLVIKGMETFSNTLMQTLFKNEKYVGNPSFSPISIYFGLLLFLIGSTGPAHDQLAKALVLEKVRYVSKLNLFLLNRCLYFAFIIKLEFSQEQILKGAQNILDGLRISKTAEYWPGQLVSIEELDLSFGLFLRYDKTFVKDFLVVLDKLGADHINVNFDSWFGTAIINR